MYSRDWSSDVCSSDLLKKEEKKKAWKGKNLAAYVWAQMLEITEEEKGEFYAAAANQGF